eukprot:gb/GECG01016306.1/.p1 GENE.gb/GECG01016306.1/~~gb/GECG01016306.1/.p1  ORF type:complete len:605 (+),score=64.10 gb/GECG01016306.1/:1-1815(+)
MSNPGGHNAPQYHQYGALPPQQQAQMMPQAAAYQQQYYQYAPQQQGQQSQPPPQQAMQMPPHNMMMPPQQYGGMPYNAPGPAPSMPPQNHQGADAGMNTRGGDQSHLGQSKSLHMREIQPTWDEEFISSFFAQFPGFRRAKVVREKSTGLPTGYGFIDFTDTPSAGQALTMMNGQPVGNTGHTFRLQWSTAPASRTGGPAPRQKNHLPPQSSNPPAGMGMYDPHNPHMPMQQEPRTAYREERSSRSGSRGRGRPQGQEEYPIFIGDIPYEANDRDLEDLFRNRYRTVINANVVKKKQTGMSKGFGFVRFSDPREAERAKREMNGAPMGNRSIRCGDATEKVDKRPPPEPRQLQSNRPAPPRREGSVDVPRRNEKRNFAEEALYTVFIGGLDRRVTRDEVGQIFSRFGQVVRVDVPPGKGVGFVEFDRPHHAQRAIDSMNGSYMETSKGRFPVRVSWRDPPGAVQKGDRNRRAPSRSRSPSRRRRSRSNRPDSRERNRRSVSPRRSREVQDRGNARKEAPRAPVEGSSTAKSRKHPRLDSVYARTDKGVPGASCDLAAANEAFSRMFSTATVSGMYGLLNISMPPRPDHPSDDPKWGTAMETRGR